MAYLSLRPLLAVLLAVVVGTCWTSPADAFPFCSGPGPTLTQDVAQASMVLFGTLTNARLGMGDDPGTDLQIEAVVKKHAVLGDRKILTLPRYVPTDKDSKDKFLIFCDVHEGTIDAYRGVLVKAESDIVAYLTGSLAYKKDIAGRLKHAFKFLDSAEAEINNDAHREFALADYEYLRGVYKDLPADTIAKWLQDPSTPVSRLGMYAMMLGHCGTAKHAELLRKMLNDPEKVVSSLDSILVGYVLLKPREGWAFVNGLLKDKSMGFGLRYAGLRAVRFLWENRPDVVQKKDLVGGVLQLLEQPDIADLAIDDLRKWGRWEVTDRVLDLFGRKSHDYPIMRRAIMRFALSCPASNARAAEFIGKMQMKDPELVQDVEELLKLETPAAVSKK